MLTDTLSDRERAFVCLLRDIEQVISLGTLSPLERAVMAGAKVMFDQLSVECDQMLSRKVSDLVGPASKLAAAPDSASSSTVAAALDRPTDTPGAGVVPSSGVQPAAARESHDEHLTRLDSQFEQVRSQIQQVIDYLKPMGFGSRDSNK